jgi:hypothetical protein
MANPSGLLYAKVVGRYQMFLADSADPDDLPDFVDLEGTGIIKPNVLEARNVNPGLTSTYLPRDVPITVENGWLTSAGNAYVNLLRSSPGVTPTDFNYSITLQLRPVLSSEAYITYGPYSFSSVPDAVTGVVDLALAVPVAASAGTPVIVGPRGPENLRVQPTDPLLDGAGMWVQTGLGPSGQDFTIWIEDGL